MELRHGAVNRCSVCQLKARALAFYQRLPTVIAGNVHLRSIAYISTVNRFTSSAFYTSAFSYQYRFLIRFGLKFVQGQFRGIAGRIG